MNDELLILPFDHRSSFSRDILGVKGKKLTSTQKKKIVALKEIIFQGFLAVYQKIENKNSLAILVDEEYGWPIIKKAKRVGITICLPVEKSGQAELEFEYGADFGRHIKAINPDYVKVLVRYNPLNRELNQRQLVKLQTLGDFCRRSNYRLMLELLVSPTAQELARLGTLKNFDSRQRHHSMARAIKEIKKYIFVDIWKLEGLERKHWKKVLRVIDKNSRVIFLGRGEDKSLVNDWLLATAPFERIIGFAIGRTIFLAALQQYSAKEISRQQAVKIIAANFNLFIRRWRENRR